jgi:hypothetical protein
MAVRSVRQTAAGTSHKITIIDESSGWVLEQHAYDTRGQLVASATASDHRQDPATGVTLPRHVDLYWPAARMQLKIDIRELEINKLGPHSAQLWEQPTYQGFANVDLADPNVRLPQQAMPGPAPALPSPSESQPVMVRKPVGWLDRLMRR